MSTDVLEGSERVPKTAGDFLGAIETQATALKAAAERNGDTLTTQLVDEIATGLRSRVEEVCAGGNWKERQRLEWDIGKFGHTVKRNRREIGKDDRRNNARGKNY